MLDGRVAYMNPATKKVLTQWEYMIQFENNDIGGGPEIEHEEYDLFHDSWASDKVNPYRDIRLTTPFVIKFDQKTFTHPVDHDIVITSRFGRRRRGPHRGLDIDLVTGDIVRSVLPGKVRFVGYSRGHGKTIVVRHPNEVETVYAHLSDYAVKEDDIVKEGQILGMGGNTGNSRGSHLHLEVRYKGIAIHPEYVFNFDGSKSIRGKDLWITNEWKNSKFHNSYRKSEIKPLLDEEAAIHAEKNEKRYHKVRKGDTLYGIALKHNTTLKEVCKMNSISKSTILSIGQVLRVR